MELLPVALVGYVVLLVLYSMLAVALYFALYRRLLRRIRRNAWRVLFLVLARPLVTAVTTFLLTAGLLRYLAGLEKGLLVFALLSLAAAFVVLVVLDAVVGLIAASVSNARRGERTATTA